MLYDPSIKGTLTINGYQDGGNVEGLSLLFKDKVSDNWFKITTDLSSIDDLFITMVTNINDFAKSYNQLEGDLVNLGIGFTRFRPMSDLHLRAPLPQVGRLTQKARRDL